MIIGTGIDTSSTLRIKNLIDKHDDRFLNKIFTSEEINYCNKKSNNIIHYAARFSAKEAFGKALGIGISKDFVWKDITIKNNENGKLRIFKIGLTVTFNKPKIIQAIT